MTAAALLFGGHTLLFTCVLGVCLCVCVCWVSVCASVRVCARGLQLYVEMVVTDPSMLSDTRVYTIAVMNDNDAPTIDPFTFYIREEDAIAGADIGTVFGADPDNDPLLTYEFVNPAEVPNLGLASDTGIVSYVSSACGALRCLRVGSRTDVPPWHCVTLVSRACAADGTVTSQSTLVRVTDSGGLVAQSLLTVVIVVRGIASYTGLQEEYMLSTTGGRVVTMLGENLVLGSTVNATYSDAALGVSFSAQVWRSAVSVPVSALVCTPQRCLLRASRRCSQRCVYVCARRAAVTAELRRGGCYHDDVRHCGWCRSLSLVASHHRRACYERDGKRHDAAASWVLPSRGD